MRKDTAPNNRNCTEIPTPPPSSSSEAVATTKAPDRVACLSLKALPPGHHH